MSGSLIANRRMINKIFPPVKIEKQNSFCIRSNTTPIDTNNPYNWDVKEDYDFLDGKYQLDELEGLYSQPHYRNPRSRSMSDVLWKPVNEIDNFNAEAKDLPEARVLNILGNLKLFKVDGPYSHIEKDIKELISHLNEKE